MMQIFFTPFTFFKNFIQSLQTNNRLERNIPLMYLYQLFWKMQFSLPIEVIYFASITGSYMRAMSLYAIGYMTGACLGVPVGFLSDKFGRRMITMFCTLARLIAAFLYAFAGSYEILVVGALFMGIYRSMGTTNNDSLVYESLIDLHRKEEYHRIISRCKSLSALGLALGALFGSIFIFISLKTAMVATLFPIAIAFVTTLFLKDPLKQKNTASNPFKHIKKAMVYIFYNKRLLWFSLAEASYFGLNEASFTFSANFYKTLVPEWSLSIWRFLGHLMNSLTSYFSARIGKWIGIERTILAGALLDNLLNIIGISLSNIGTLFLKTGASGCFGVYSPASGVFLQNEASLGERGTILSLSSLLNGGMYSMCSLFIGWLGDQFSPFWAMLIGYSLAFASNGFYLISFRQKKIGEVAQKEMACPVEGFRKPA